jgi:hypothetical protein
MTDLQTLLDLATDELRGPDLTDGALAEARRRRTRRRGAVAGLAVAATVAGVVVAPRMVGSDSDRERPSERPTSGPTPTMEESAPVPPPIPADARHPAWDPATAAELPNYPIESLPTVLALEGSRSSPGDRAEPLALSRSAKDKLLLQYGARSWYGLRRPADGGDLWDSALSRDGERIAVVGEGGLFWCDAVEVCPEWDRVDVPEMLLGEDTRMTWTQDSSRVVLADADTAYVVDLDSGEVVERPSLGGGTAFDFAPDGRLVTVGGVASLAAFEDGVVATRVPDDGDEGDGGLVVLSWDGRTVEKLLPVEGDVRGMVARGELRPLQWLNKVTILFAVTPPGTGTTHLVTWDLVTWDEYGEENHGHVASYPASYDVSLRDLYPA